MFFFFFCVFCFDFEVSTNNDAVVADAIFFFQFQNNCRGLCIALASFAISGLCKRHEMMLKCVSQEMIEGFWGDELGVESANFGAPIGDWRKKSLNSKREKKKQNQLALTSSNRRASSALSCSL